MHELHCAAVARKSVPRNSTPAAQGCPTLAYAPYYDDADQHLTRFAKRHRLPLRLAALIAELAGISGAR